MVSDTSHPIASESPVRGERRVFATLNHLWLRHEVALLLALLALMARLTFVLILDPSPDFSGGDANWYMQNGRVLAETGKTAGPLPTPPLYLVFVGVVQILVPGHPSGGEAYTVADMQAVRVIQSVLGALLCLFAYWLARRTFSERAGWLAAGILALSPTLIIESGNLVTEDLFLFFVFGGLALYVCAQNAPTSRAMICAGIMFGLATLTRAIFLLFPLGIAGHLLLTHRTRWLRPALILVISYVLVISTWTIYNWLAWDRLIIGGEGILSFVYQGATSQLSPEEMDAQLQIFPENENPNREEVLRQRIEHSIRRDPLGWAVHRVKELGAAYLQPHNTVYFEGESIRAAASRWLRSDRSPGGLIDLTRIEAFWPKLTLYLFHWSALLLGLAGMVIARRRWRTLLPLYGMVVYFTGIHVVLLALPRYLFPLYPVFWIFGAAFLVTQWDARRSVQPVLPEIGD
jgi:4-amino-4-deoxy-L-arabinose transferase-like glycosyltransferase